MLFQFETIKHALFQQPISLLIILAQCLFITLNSNAATRNSEPQQSSTQLIVDASDNALERQLWNLQDADIHSVINLVADITGKNFLIDPQVQGEVTLVSSKPLTQDEIYPVFLSMLQVLGYSAIPSGDVIRIIPENQGMQAAHPTRQGESLPLQNEIVVQVIPVEHVSTEQLIPILRPLLPNTAHIASYTPANSLIIAGATTDVARIATIIEQIDVFNADESEVEIIPIHNAIAADLVQTIQGLLSSQTANSNMSQVYLAADDASNTILISGNLNRRLQTRVLISQLDNRSPTGLDRDTEVIYLKYLNANDLVPVLASVARANFGEVGTTIGTNPSLPGNRPGFNTTQNRAFGLANSLNGGGLFESPIAGPFTNPYGSIINPDSATYRNNRNFNNNFNTSSGETPGSTVTIEGGSGNSIEIAAETTTNSIVVTGPTDLIRALKRVLARIDIRPAQVLVEALIVEISENQILDLGIDWTDRRALSNIDPTTGLPSSTPFSTLATFGTNFGVGFIRAGDIEIVIEALQQNTNTHILSTPSLVVLDNQEAAISVGQTVPFPSTTFGINNTDVTPVTSFTREDVALSLAVIPQINHDNSLTLQLFHENETIDPTSAEIIINGQPTGIPTTSKSEIQTSVIVEDGDVLVLGGLISNQQSRSRRVIPFLSAIPLIGLVFQSHQNNDDRRNLMIFLRPQIIRAPDEGVTITDSKYQYIRNQQVRVDNELQLNYIPAPWEIEIRLPEPFSP